MRILITGGAGFVGSHLAIRFKRRDPGDEVIALDNLKRRGSELNLEILKRAGVRFVHADVREPSDFQSLSGNFDVMIDASAEPSVRSGLGESPRYVLETNLGGTVNCLEFARERAGFLIFLSTSRVYSIKPLRALALTETATRLEMSDAQAVNGASHFGIAESFPTDGARSLYGATKLGSELLIQEYAHQYGLKAVINRCGVLCGAGQFGKVDQGVFALWVIHHHFGLPLTYTGFGGQGKQVRDLLHPTDLFELLEKQMAALPFCAGRIFNVGGGADRSVSLRELTALCREITGRAVPIGSDTNDSPVDIPYYVSDHRRVTQALDWKPTRTIRSIVSEIHGWLKGNEPLLRSLFVPEGAASPPILKRAAA